MAEEARTFSRYVRPIYDAIDQRQYKVAIKLAQNKKIASLDIVQVLRAHCLERTGKPGEALALCRAVQQRRPTDETLLNTMALVFRLCGHEHEMLPTYEHACAATAAAPNEELLQALFVAYARKGDFLKQQQTALKMFKAFANIKHVCWAALSMLLQVQHTGATPKMLALADRMLLKTMRETQSDDGEALQLLVHILQLQDKHAEALAAFDEFAPLMLEDHQKKKKKEKEDDDHCHDHGCSHSHEPSTSGRAAEGEGAYEDDIELGPLQAIDRLALEAALCKTVGQWTRCGDVYLQLLTKFNADDWTYLTEFIHARVREHDGEVPRCEAAIRSVLASLAAAPGNEHLRGPHLALVHLQSEKLQHAASNGSSDHEAAALVAAILAYTDRFFTKTCCFSDLKQYFALLCDDAFASSKQSLVASLQAMGEAATAVSAGAMEEDEAARPEALRQLHRRLFSLKSLRFLGAYTASSVSDLESLVASLVAEYDANAWLNLGATGGQREVQTTDDLLLLAAHTLLQLYQKEGTAKTAYLVDAATLLEFGLARSGYNFQMKLLLARVYAYAGASDAMLARHRELDVKHVQLDSLSFLVWDKLRQLGDTAALPKMGDALRRLHRSTDSDTPEFIARAYRLGVYSKVLDMTRFLRERMQRSHALAIARGEHIHAQLQAAVAGGPGRLGEWVVDAAKPVDELEEMLRQPLSANMDRQVVVAWDRQPLVATRDAFAADALVECDRSASMDTSLQWLRLQLVAAKLLRAVAASDSASVGALADEYVALVTSLGLLSDTSEDVQTQIWAWSVAVVQCVDADDAVAIAALQTPLASVRDGVAAALLKDGTLSAHGVATATLLLRDAGLWAGALLCAATRAKKRSKKAEDGVAAALRGVVKGVQEMLSAVEAHVTGLQLSLRPTATVALSVVAAAAHTQAAEDVRSAQRAVLENVARSHEATQQLLAERLKNAAASMRLFLQK